MASSADHLRPQAAGCFGHLDKPVDDAGLIAAVASRAMEQVSANGGDCE